MSLLSRYYTKQNIQNKLNETAEEIYNENISEIMSNMDKISLSTKRIKNLQDAQASSDYNFN